MSVNAKIVIKASVVTGLKSLLCELKNRELYRSLPDHAILTAIDTDQLLLLKHLRNIGHETKKMRRDASLPYVEVLKLTNNNFDNFNAAFTTVVSL